MKFKSTQNLVELVTLYQQYKHLRPASTHNYRKIATLFSDRVGADKAIVSKITIDDALMFRDMVLKNAKSVTWNTYNRHLRALINFSKKIGVRSDNPFDNLFLRCDHVHPTEKTVTTQELRKLRSYLASPSNSLHPGWFWETVILTFYYTAIRRRQLIELSWGDIRFNRKLIRLRGEFSKNHQTRHIPIHPDLLPKLYELRTRSVLENAVTTDNDQVFNVTLFNPRYRHNKLEDLQLTGFFVRLKNKTGVNISAHRIRHTCATRLMRLYMGKNSDSVSLRVIQQLLGHQTITTTAAYLHPDENDLKHMVSKLPSL